jgi:hypothetical protein
MNYITEDNFDEYIDGNIHEYDEDYETRHNLIRNIINCIEQAVGVEAISGHSYEDGDDARIQDEEAQNPHNIESENPDILLRLLDHPFGDSSILGEVYDILEETIDQKAYSVERKALETARACYSKEVEFQTTERQPCCPICQDTDFSHTHTFHRCTTCRGAICSDCAPFVQTKCPICRAANPFELVSQPEMEKKELGLLPSKMTVRDLVYQVRYCPFQEGRNIFGEICNITFNMESITHSEFDLELAELLRLTSLKLTSIRNNMDDVEFHLTLQRDMPWAVHIEQIIEY